MKFPKKNILHDVNRLCYRYLWMMCLLFIIAETSAFSKQTTFDYKYISIENLLDIFENKYDVRFIYKTKEVDLKKKISLSVDNVSMEEALKKIFAGTDTKINVSNQWIFLKSENKEATKTHKIVEVEQQQSVVKGQVLDEKGNPISEATVSIKGTKNIVNTDDNGFFSIAVSDDNTILICSHIGFETEEIRIGQQKELSIQMKIASQNLEEFVVVGYSSQRKELVSSSMASVSAEKLNRNTPVLLDQSLQGKAAGVQVNSKSGSPGSGFNILIRGVTTNGDNSPLILMDGIPMGGDISILDPNDIEKIDIIKDASTAIYGVRGANGVILITTKKGKKNQKPSITYNGIYSIQQTSKKIDLMTAGEYSTYLNESEIADGKTLPFPNVDTKAIGTDWQDQLFRNSPLTSHNLSLIGGGENVSYNFSGSYLSHQGMIAPHKSYFDRWTVKSDVMINITPQFKATAFLLYTDVTKSTIPEGGRGSFLYHALNASPRAFVLDGKDQTKPSRGFAYIGNEQGNEIINPLALIYNTNNLTKNSRFSGKGELSYEIIKKLTLTSRFSFNYADVRDRFYFPLVYYGQNKVINNASLENNSEFDVDRNNDGDRDVFSTVDENIQTYFDYTWETFATYDFSLKKHNFSLLAGISLLSAQYLGTFTSGYLKGLDNWENAFVSNTQSFIFDKDGTNAGNDIQENKNPSTGRGDDRLFSTFFRVQYDYAGKYLLSAMVRQDGSNRFGPSNRIGYFPSFSLGWVVDKEKFFNISFIDKLKIRASWGITGNDKIGSYRWLGFLQGANAEATYPFGNVLVRGNATGKLANPDLKWETNQQFDAGLDVTFLNSSLQFSLDYFIKQTNDLLITPEVSALLGASAGGSSAPVVNAGSVQNMGFDWSLSYSKEIAKNLTFRSSFNLSHYSNQVISVNNAAGFISSGIFGLSEKTSRMKTGLPLGVFYGLTAEGVFQNQNEIDKHAKQSGAKVGDVKYKDADGDGVVEFGSEDDLRVIGNPIPDAIMSLSVGFEFHGVDVSCLFYSVLGHEIVRSYERFLPYSNRLALYLNRWRGEGTSNTLPIASSASSNNYIFSSLFVEDGSYFRIQNIQIGYSFPKTLIRKIRLKQLRIYFSVNNIYTLTHYLGYDPDASTADPLAAGVDQGQYPQARTFTFGLTTSL